MSLWAATVTITKRLLVYYGACRDDEYPVSLLIYLDDKMTYQKRDYLVELSGPSNEQGSHPVKLAFMICPVVAGILHQSSDISALLDYSSRHI